MHIEELKIGDMYMVYRDLRIFIQYKDFDQRLREVPPAYLTHRDGSFMLLDVYKLDRWIRFDILYNESVYITAVPENARVVSFCRIGE